MKFKSFVAALALGVFCYGATTADAADKKLYLYTWDSYVDAELFKKFEKETGIEVVADVYSSNEGLAAKLKAGGGFDVIAPSGNFVPLLIEEKLLMPLPDDLKALGAKMNKDTAKPTYDPDFTYALPLFYGTSALAINPKLVKEDVTSWKQFFERPAGEDASLGVLDDLSTVTNIASLYLGKPYCDDKPETFKAIQEVLLKQKPFVRVYGATGYTERLAAGEIAMQMAWSGDIYKVREENPDIRYVYPKEGVEVWIDNVAIPAGAKNIDEAKKFIEFILRPENSAVYSQSSGNMPAVAGAHDHLPEAMKKAPEFNIPDGIPTPVTTSCPAEVIEAYDKIWSKLTQ